MIKTMVPMIVSRKDNGMTWDRLEAEAPGLNTGRIPGFDIGPSDSMAREAAVVDSSVATDSGAKPGAVTSEAAHTLLKK